ncbi:MAG TPA: helix-turn-helix domain-containing protein [Jiangellaceae bacterium]|nr:helix-turn-helix domain-containing protein [Jiangellaceae bacterium]
MGNREALLQGARACLLDKGFERTTVRDIATAAGVSMAAIGYHYGSREALLNAALYAAMDEWGYAVQRAMGTHAGPPEGTSGYEAMWSRMIASFEADRTLWVASIEAFLRAVRSPESREHLLTGMRQARRGQAAAVLDADIDHLDDPTVRTVGSVQLALLTGTMMQWLIDPDNAPSEQDILDGLGALNPSDPTQVAASPPGRE